MHASQAFANGLSRAQEILSVIGIIGTISTVLPAFLIAAVVITLVYWVMGIIYIASSRELKRSGTYSSQLGAMTF